MNNDIPYKVIVSTDKGINVILSNRSVEHERTYSHFMSAEDSAFFANTIKLLMEPPSPSTLDRCAICGKHFLKKDKLCQLKNGAVSHRACFLKEERNRHLEYSDLDKYLPSPFPDGEPEFEFSNLAESDYRFRFAVQIVSDIAIHLYCRDGSSGKHHFVLTKRECLELAGEITRQLKAIRDAEVGVCFHCGNKIYIDQERYEMDSGELVHSRCMDKFVQSFPASGVTFPAKKIRLVDRFSHASYYPGQYYKAAFLVE